jgi:hypothetical protein
LIAGFAERLVPDSLDTLAQKLDAQSHQPQANLGPSSAATTAALITPPPNGGGSLVAETAIDDALHTGESTKTAETEI